MKGTPFGRHELLRKIAAGGMAEIFLARRWGEGGFFLDVVIKRLFRHLIENPRTLRMFQYEARLLSELRHPNIPQAYELGFVDGYWYMAMEFVDGYTVSDAWRAGARAGRVMPMHIAVGVVMQACEALHHAHEQRDRAGRQLRIVHRDVTPHNIMLTRDGVVKVMDFGVAQTAARRDSEAGALKGTFSYMAPEQVRARHLDKRADVFALGVILFELTTGTRLFRGNDVQVMTAIVEKDAPPPSTRVPGYPSDLEEIVVAALARDRSQRLPSAAHLALALEGFAMRHRLLVGPRAIARYMGSVYPYERERERELGLVQRRPRLELVSQVVQTGEWEVDFDEDIQTDQQILGGDLEDSGLLRDLDLLDPTGGGADATAEAEGGANSAVRTFVDPSGGFDLGDTTQNEVRSPDDAADHEASAPPPPLEGFDEEQVQRPVVLLQSPKHEPPEKGDYLRDLQERLEKDPD